MDPQVEVEVSKSKVPIWLPISAFIGTSVAIAIPLLMVRRQRRALTPLLKRTSLSTPSSSSSSSIPPAPPPRRTQAPGGTTVSDLSAKLKARASAASATTTNLSSIFKAEGPSDETSPGVGSLMSAMSQMNLSNAMFAGKAFVIATALVAVGGGIFAWSVKTMLGVNEAHEFGTKMRSFLWSSWPSLAARIHRGPESDSERHDSHSTAPFGIEDTWDPHASERRLQKAYDEGGVGVWAKVAVRELEAEARVERAKRRREVEEHDSTTVNGNGNGSLEGARS